MNHEHDPHQTPPDFWRSRYSVGLLVIGAVAAYFLLAEHWAHVAGALPFLLVLACPLMHLFMHGGHGHRHGDEAPRGTPSKPDSTHAGDQA